MRLRMPMLTALAVGTLLSACQPAADGAAAASGVAAPATAPAGTFNGVDITGAAYGRKLNLNDMNGKPRSLEEFKGKVLVVFFGYTHCPDVCPTTMAELAAVKNALGADGAKVQPIFVSVDPERDTPELLRTYMSNFGPDFLALTGTSDEIKAVAKEFRVVYTKVPGKVEGNYTVDHTAGSYIFDPKGYLRLFTRYGTKTDLLTADIKRLLAGG